MSPENWESLVPGNADAVIDACDQVQVKTALAAWSLKTKTVFVTSGAAGGKRLAHLTNIDDIASVTHDPLLSRCAIVCAKVLMHHATARILEFHVCSVQKKLPRLTSLVMLLAMDR